MINPKAHEVVERVEKAAPKYTGETCSSTRRASWIEGAHFGIRLALEMEEVKAMREALIHVQCLRRHGSCLSIVDRVSAAELACSLVDQAIGKFDALKLLHVPSGGVE